MHPETDVPRAHRPPIICTIGDLILDVIVLPEHPLVADADTPATIRFSPGGQAANVAAWAAALGATTHLICARGRDDTTWLAAAELAGRGVRVCGPILDGRGGVVVSVRGRPGERTMASDRGVAALMEPDQLDPEWVRSCDVLHISGYCLLRDPMAQTAIKAARYAKRTTVDLASAHDIVLAGVEQFVGRLDAIGPDLVFATEAERAVVPHFDGQWVIKHGAGGALFPEGEWPAQPAQVLDTTGAGDALAAGYLVGGPELAMQAAARCVSVIGAMPPVEE